MEFKLKFYISGILILQTVAGGYSGWGWGDREDRKSIGSSTGNKNTGWIQTAMVSPSEQNPTTKRPSTVPALQNYRMEAIFREWTLSVQREFLPKFLQLVERNGLKIGDCPETTLGLDALLTKIKTHLVQLQATDRTESRKDVEYYDEYLKSLVGLRQRLEFLGKESRSEGDHGCTRLFREKHENVTHEVQGAEEVVKEKVKGFLLDSTIRNIRRKQLGAALSPLKDLESHDLNVLLGSLVQSLFPSQDAFPAPNFDSMLWFIEAVGSQYPSLTEMLSRLLLDKLRAFKLMSTPYVIHLAYIVRATQASEDLQERFPPQIQSLIWGRTSCIQNTRTRDFLVERPFNADDLPMGILLVETRQLEPDYGSGSVKSCGWEILPTAHKDDAGNIEFISFLIRREISPETIWNLGVVNRTITLRANNQPGRVLWDILPEQKTPDNFVFKIRNVPTPQNSRVNRAVVDNNFLCYEFPANRDALGETKLSRFENGSCEWTLENTT